MQILKDFGTIAYMVCPECEKMLKPQKIGSTVYWRCDNCHGLWFDNMESDFLTLEEAKELKRSGNKSLEKDDYLCPKCHKKLEKDQNNYWRCYDCGGMFTNADSLIKEKQYKASQFTKSVKKPFKLSQFQSVVVMAALIAFIGVNLVIFNSFNQKTTIQSRASEVKNNLRFQKVNNNQISVFFATKEPYISNAIFKANNKVWEKTISIQPSLTHFVIIEKPKQTTSIAIKLTAIDQTETITEAVIIPKK